MFIEQIKIAREVRIDNQPERYAGDHKDHRPPFEPFFAPAGHDGPYDRCDEEQHKHVVGQGEDERERQERPEFLFK
jgi:hypothetical protein